jgi:hypothetical protein
VVRNRVPVLIDGGFRRGTDVFEALALGATAFCIGRPYMWGLAAFPQPGVETVLEILRRECNLTMAKCGEHSLAEKSQHLQSSERGEYAESVPVLAGRIRIACLVRRLCYECAHETPMSAMLKFAPPTQLLFGTDYPAEPIETTVNELPNNDLPAQIQRAMNRDNAEGFVPAVKA